MNFNVPYYAQTSEFTCGPACLLMVMKHFHPRLRLGRELEFEVWRQCNMIGIKGADPYGLSIPLSDAGYKVHLTTQYRGIVKYRPWKRRLRRLFSREEIEPAPEVAPTLRGDRNVARPTGYQYRGFRGWVCRCPSSREPPAAANVSAPAARSHTDSAHEHAE